ncbi:MAG TPA: hopanoid biosynthesis protein HpnM [Alphaproteobacteria bacterium]|nr:hopanoid biosynthesis protein HpnM [Alphaproteobacteria bacterium]
MNEILKNTPPRRFLFAVLLIASFIFPPSISGAAAAKARPPTATALVVRFQNGLMAVMKEAAALGVKGRYERLAPLIDDTFYLPLMTQIASGPYWDRADEAERSRLVAAFHRMSAGTLATLFDGWSGQVFKITGEVPGPQKTTVVKTRLVETDGSSVALAYIAKKIHGAWFLIDVVVDNGISELNIRRSEYLMLLKTKGVDGLIKALNAKADRLIGQ